MNRIRYCPKCKLYTLSEKCPKCGGETYEREPPKFSYPDKFAYYRRIEKKKILKEKGLL